MKRILICAAIMWLFGGGPSFSQPGGKIIFVDHDATGSGNGSSWEDAFVGLVQALDSARSADEIWVAEGVYLPGTGRTSSFRLKDGVTLYGGFDGTEASLAERDWVLHRTLLSGDVGVPGDRGDNCYHVVANTLRPLDSTAILDGFIITGGEANGSDPDNHGGGMLNIQASPLVRNSVFEENDAEGGGGMYNFSSSPIVQDCIFRCNSAFDGGGMYNRASSPVLTRTTFFGNTGAYGGGLVLFASSPTVEDCVFELNRVYDSGGAMGVHDGSTPLVRRCVFLANTAENGCAGAVWHWFNGITAEPTYLDCRFELNYGGAVSATMSAPRIERSLFVDNLTRLDADGGGMLVWENSAPVLVNCTFSGNFSRQGRAVACLLNAGVPSRVILVNCILWDGGDEVANNDNSTIVIAHSDIAGGFPGPGNLSADPLFLDEFHHDFHLFASSPAIDAGTAHFTWNGTPIVSLDSSDYFGSAPDMGALEWSRISLRVPVLRSWNLVSVPLEAPDYQRANLFPSSISHAFLYLPGIGYALTDTLGNGPGYWLKFPTSETVTLNGFSISADSVEVLTGWNLVGSVSSGVPVDSIGSIPGGIITSEFIGYTPLGYAAVSVLEPGLGYWVKVSQPGKLVLSSIPSPMQKIIIVATGELPPAPPGEVTEKTSAELPKETALEQNYPNPFNPISKFEMRIAKWCHVNVTVYDLMGREVAVLVDEEKEPGSYTVTFDGSCLASGMYLYRLTAGGFTATKRMMLVK